MKLLHTADWHLGKTLKGQNLIDDQDFILKQLFDIINDQKPDAILICGDIYDRAIPPVDAVKLFDETLTKFAEKNIPTLIIAGNHDSATRLNFGKEIFKRQNIFIAAKEPETITLQDNFGEIYFSMIPYDTDTTNIAFARENISKNKRSVVLAHVFLAGGIESPNSERKIFVGGAENVPAELFNGYNYVALGHLHRPQKFYSGSPLKYSFDEANHKKSVNIVEIDALGAVKLEKIPLNPRHDVRIVSGNLYKLLNETRTEDYICARLTERVINVQDKLANVFPKLLSVEWDLPQNLSSNTSEPKKFSAVTSIIDYFADFFEAQTQEPLNAEYRAAMNKFLTKLDNEEREI